MDEKKIWKQKLVRAQEGDLYKHLTQRRFHKIGGYGRFDRAIASVSALLQVTARMKLKFIQRDAGLYVGCQLFADLVVTPNFPVLAIDRTLLTALEQTAVPPDIFTLKPILKTGLILLPQKTIQTPDGDWIDWIAFRHSEAGQLLTPLQTAEGINRPTRMREDSIGWATQPSVITWASNQPLSRWASEEPPPMSGGDATDQTLSLRLSTLLANFLLYLQNYPQDVQPGNNATGFSSITQNTKRRSPKILSPRWVGRGYKQPQERPSQGHRKHTSPQMHWRRGHWRRVPVGKGRKGRKWCWIKPVLVNLE